MDVRNITVADRLDTECERENSAQVTAAADATVFPEIWEQQVTGLVGNSIHWS